MSWTTLATVRKHLQETTAPQTAVENEEHIMNAQDPVQLGHASLTQASEEIKTIDLAAPYAAGTVVLSAYNWRGLPHGDLVPGTLVVASNPALAVVYVEGTDYVIHRELGRIKRVAGTSIPDGATVHVWYYYYTVHSRGTDYTLDYASGQLARVEGGGIADGSTVYVDYATTAGTVTDDLINQGILEAEDKILARLKEGYGPGSTDQGLATGATELALSIVCNAQAMEAVRLRPTDEADGAAAQWRETSRRYEIQAWRTLDRFLKARSRRGSAAVRNESWEGWE
ncbi:MAG: hypothetical protein C4524_12760 [Candidatus Zixiibacteriota bacterium]|nr:MAG: hypothetical protein C4524_12760 [candidate division Zixibacteria bacterium]